VGWGGGAGVDKWTVATVVVVGRDLLWHVGWDQLGEEGLALATTAGLQLKLFFVLVGAAVWQADVSSCLASCYGSSCQAVTLAAVELL
jgi:hypothetical protein